MGSLTLDAAELVDFARQLEAAGVKLADLAEPNAEAGRVVIAATRPPRLSGQLAASTQANVTAQGVTFASTARYWTFIHWGAPRRNIKARPYLRDALELATADVVAVYAEHAQHALPD